MVVTKIIEGLQILEKYNPKNKDGYIVRAEHDMIYAGSLYWEIPEDQKNRLEELGWGKDEDADGYTASL